MKTTTIEDNTLRRITQMKTALVTGANSFIGNHVVRELLKVSAKVFAVVRNRSSHIANLTSLPKARILFCELSEIQNLPDMIKSDIDIFFHFAWGGTLRDYRANYEMQLANVKHELDAVNACARLNCPRFIGVGTIAEFDCYAYCTEDSSAPLPSSHYGSAKVAARLMTRAECTRLGIEHIWTQPASVYGPGDNSNNFINLAMDLIGSDKRASFTKGDQLYDFIYVTDAAAAFRLIGEKGKPMCTYYIGSGNPRPLKEYIFEMRRIINPGKPIHLGDLEYRGAFMRKDQLDCAKLKKDTGFVPQVSFEVGITDCMRAWPLQRSVEQSLPGESQSPQN